MVKRVYVWEFPVRLTHWLNVLSILTLSFTGFYIGAPFIHAVSEDQFIMAQMRYIHFIAGYVFAVSMAVRIYWSFVGNKYSRWTDFVPLTSQQWKNIVDTAKFYAFLKKEPVRYAGHTGLAALTYSILFILPVVAIFTGFALYSESHPPGILWTIMGGWLFSIMSTGTVRLLHHSAMWLLLIFAFIHIYMSWFNDLAERNGLISSIFSGYKSMEE